jgi:hypothetical protein
LTNAIRFPFGLAKALVDQRKLVLKYETNRVVKAYDTFTCLKSTNICGVISNYTDQLPELTAICKISRTAFYNRIQDCIKLKLITKRGTQLHLTSWTKACEMFDVVNTGVFHNINYNLSDTKQTIQHIIAAIALKEKEQIIQLQVAKKLNANPDVKEAYDVYMKHFLKSETEFCPAALFNAQRKSYSEGAPSVLYEALHKINPDCNRTVKSIQKDFGMKSHRSATYLKRNLAKRGLLTIEKRGSAVYNYSPLKPSTIIEPSNDLTLAFMVTHKNGIQGIRAKKSEHHHVWYDKIKNARTWHITDAITINPKTFN